MDQAPIFSDFLRNILGVTVNRTLNEITSFIETFADLLSSSDSEIDTFVKEVHSSNSARNANLRILISSNVVMGLKSVLFELKDRQLCNALPDVTTLNNLDAGQVNIMRRLRRSALDDMASKKAVKLPDMKVPKLTNTNFEDWNTAFSSVVGRQYSLADVTLDYLLRDNDVGDYSLAWTSRDEKIKNCISLSGTRYKFDREGLYSLVVEHIGTDGCGLNI